MIPGTANAMYEILIGSFCLAVVIGLFLALPTSFALYKDNKEEKERKNID